MDEPTERSVDAALKKLRLGPYAPPPSLAEQVRQQALKIHQRVAEMVKQAFKDKAPSKEEFARLVGALYEAELRGWQKSDREQFLYYIASLHMELAYKRLID